MTRHICLLRDLLEPSIDRSEERPILPAYIQLIQKKSQLVSALLDLFQRARASKSIGSRGTRVIPLQFSKTSRYLFLLNLIS